MDKQTTLNPIATSGDEAIMSALNAIINKTPNTEQKKFKIGTAIILMLKRVKLRELMIKQIKATELWKRYVRQQKKENSKDPIIHNLMEIIPEPTDESLNNFKEKERKLVIRIPFIPEWWDDIDYLRHIDEVMTLFKITKKQLIDYIELYLKKTALASVLSNPTTTDENRTVRIVEVREFMNKKIEKLKKGKEFEFRQGIYYPTDLKQTDFTQRDMESNRNMVFEKSNLIINSQYFPEDFEKNLIMTIGLGNSIEDMEEVEKQLRSFVRITDNGRRISSDQDEVEFIKKYYIYFIHKPDSLHWENMLNDMELTSTDINNKIFLEKPTLPMNTLMKMVPATNEYSIGAPFELQTVDNRQMVFFFQMEIGLGESFNNDVLKKSRDLYNQKVKEAFSKQKKHNPFAKTEEDVEKEKQEKLAAAKARRKKKGNKKFAAVVTDKPALDDDALAAMFDEEDLGSTQDSKGKKKKNKKKKKKKKKEESQDDDKKPPAPQSGKTSPLPQSTAKLIQGDKDEDLYNYLKNECGEKDEVQIIIWSVINKYLKNVLFGEKGYYSGGFATYLLTKGKYPTTDIDYKIYPPQQGEKLDEETIVKEFKKHAGPMFKDIIALLPQEMKGYYSNIHIGKPPKNPDGPIKITLELSKPQIIQLKEPELVNGTVTFSVQRSFIAYCDIGFWSPDDLINDLELPFINGIYPKHDKALLDKLDMYVIDKQFMIAEKEIFLKKLNNPTMKHKIENWTNQLELLEGLGKKEGGRKKRTRKRIKKYKKRRTKKKKKRTKKKRRKRRKKTRRRK